MPIFIPGGTLEVVAIQYKASDKELDIVNLFDWIHDTDSSTIYGAVSGSIMKEIEAAGGIWIPHKSGPSYIARKYLAMDGDWIIRHDALDFTVMSDKRFKELYYVKAH